MYIVNRCTACRVGVFSCISNEQRMYWLAKRQNLKACTKMISCGKFRFQRECFFLMSAEQAGTAFNLTLMYPFFYAVIACLNRNIVFLFFFFFSADSLIQKLLNCSRKAINLIRFWFVQRFNYIGRGS